MQTRFGISTGLILSGTIAMVVLAYALGFLAIFFGSLASLTEQITPNFAAAARTLGRTAFRTPMEILFPILGPRCHLLCCCYSWMA
jgi:iron(III) transport system permease protein